MARHPPVRLSRAHAVSVRLGSCTSSRVVHQAFPSEYHRQRLFTEKPKQMLAVQRFENRDNAPLVSIPERALLELLDDVGVRQPLQEAKEIMEGAHTMRADVLIKLLKRCTSVKTVRLCLTLARELSLPWAEKLNRATLPTGSARPWILNTARRLAGAQALNQIYLDTARLLIQVAPLVFADNIFALKGGTAINLFVRDMPRLSVDLDLVFVDHTVERTEALNTINQAIRSMVERLKKRGFQTHTATATEAGETKIFVRRGKLKVKVEVNFVLRGTVHPIRAASLRAKAKKALQADLELPVVSLADLYGGKLVAALDRQHPRDLFDVMELFSHEGITPAIRRAFVVYLAAHNRPIHEVLFPSLRDISADYERTFKGMTTRASGLGCSAVGAEPSIISGLQTSLDTEEREFLVSLAKKRTQ